MSLHGVTMQWHHAVIHLQCQHINVVENEEEKETLLLLELNFTGNLKADYIWSHWGHVGCKEADFKIHVLPFFFDSVDGRCHIKPEITAFMRPEIYWWILSRNLFRWCWAQDWRAFLFCVCQNLFCFSLDGKHTNTHSECIYTKQNWCLCSRSSFHALISRNNQSDSLDFFKFDLIKNNFKVLLLKFK